jgi:hypothetical protein
VTSGLTGKIERAITELEDSLDPQLWLDDSHLTDKGKKVFRKEREAVNKLTQIKDPPARSRAWWMHWSPRTRPARTGDR